MNECSTFPKAPELLVSHHQIVECHHPDTHLVGWFYLSPEMQSVYSAAQAKCAVYFLVSIKSLYSSKEQLFRPYLLRFQAFTLSYYAQIVFGKIAALLAGAVE